MMKMMKMGKTTDPNSMKGIPAKGVVVPKGASSVDDKVNRHEPTRGGVGMGKEDAIGADHQFNTGRTEGVCYEHKRTAYAPEDKYEAK